MFCFFTSPIFLDFFTCTCRSKLSVLKCEGQVLNYSLFVSNFLYPHYVVLFFLLLDLPLLMFFHVYKHQVYIQFYNFISGCSVNFLFFRFDNFRRMTIHSPPKKILYPNIWGCKLSLLKNIIRGWNLDYSLHASLNDYTLWQCTDKMHSIFLVIWKQKQKFLKTMK